MCSPPTASPAAGAEVSARRRGRAEHATSEHATEHRQSGAFSIEESRRARGSVIAQPGPPRPARLQHAVARRRRTDAAWPRPSKSRRARADARGHRSVRPGDGKAPLEPAPLDSRSARTAKMATAAAACSGSRRHLSRRRSSRRASTTRSPSWRDTSARKRAGWLWARASAIKLDASQLGSGVGQKGRSRIATHISRPVRRRFPRRSRRGQNQRSANRRKRAAAPTAAIALIGVASGAAACDRASRQAGPASAMGSVSEVDVREGGTAHRGLHAQGHQWPGGRTRQRARAAALPDGVDGRARCANPAPVNVRTTFDRIAGRARRKLPARTARRRLSGRRRRRSRRRHACGAFTPGRGRERTETLTRDLVLPGARDLGLAITVLEPGGAPSPGARVQPLRGEGGEGLRRCLSQPDESWRSRRSSLCGPARAQRPPRPA